MPEGFFLSTELCLEAILNILHFRFKGGYKKILYNPGAAKKNRFCPGQACHLNYIAVRISIGRDINHRLKQE